jgi:hypothetical protein
MKMKDCLAIITVSLGTATLTVATFLANPLEAESERESRPIIKNPKLIARGIEMTLSPADGSKLKAGDEPVFELRAINTHDKPSDAHVYVTLRSTTVANPMSRMIPSPKVLWQEKQDLTLGPKETRSFRLTTRISLPADSRISVALSESSPDERRTGIEPGIVALQFSTAIANQAAK